jgi:hypothetical protein
VPFFFEPNIIHGFDYLVIVAQINIAFYMPRALPWATNMSPLQGFSFTIFKELVLLSFSFLQSPHALDYFLMMMNVRSPLAV